MRVEFLGTAGYHPSETRHTSCVYLPDAAPDSAFVLDAGTGFFRLARRPLPPQLHIFLSHAHLDHICGLTYLLDVLLNKQCEVTVYGLAHTLDVVRNDLFDSPLFPLPFNHRTQTIEAGQQFQVAGVDIETFNLTHPGGSLAYRLNWPGGQSFAYITDTAGDGKYIDFIHGVDMLVHERNFSDDLHEVADASGHCTTEAVARVGQQAEVKKLVLTHFNPIASTDPAEEDAAHGDMGGAVYAHDGLTLDF